MSAVGNVIARLLVVALIGGGSAAAQSTSATLSGVVLDEQRALLQGAAVTLTNLETGARRNATSDDIGRFRLAGLTPGRYELRLTRKGFAPAAPTLFTMTVGEEASLETVLMVAAVNEAVTVDASRVAGIEPTKTALGRTFTNFELDALPVPGRDFSTLATLTPGVLPDLNQGGGSAPNLTGFATAAQTGRNNAILIDGMSHDDALPGAMRGIVSLEAVREFVVSTNGFAAEHGQASGVVVNVVTKSGTNAFNTRAFYYHRDDAWDATPGAAKLVEPQVEKTRLEQGIIGGSVGGPLVRNRAFFFGSLEHLGRDTDHIVTSPVLLRFRPAADAVLPQRTRNPNVLGRVDVNVASADSLMARYRFDDSTATNRFIEADVRLGAPERAHNLLRRDQDVGIVDTHLVGSQGFNELRVLFGRRFVDLNVASHCGIGCATENRPGLLLGKSPNLPQLRTQDRWQFADTFTRLVGNRTGQHTLKTGFDVSFVKDANYFPLNFSGTWSFEVDVPFDQSSDVTFPRRFTQSTGSPNVDLEARMYAVFVQDQWRPSSKLTFNGGLRWDYERSPGIAHDRNNLAPRAGFSYDVTGTATTVVRGSYGHYYDQVFLLVAREVEQLAGLVQTRIEFPGYPDPLGPNPRRTSARPPLPALTQYGDNMKTPLNAEATLGVQHEFGSKMVVTADGIWARGWHLLAGHDLNYPDLDNPLRPRPNPDFQVIQAYETRGNSWYSGLQASLKRRHANGYSYYVGYTASSSERDTEDFRFLPQDQRDYAADRGPGANDSRHRLVANATGDLPWALRVAGVLTARSALPYNITTGRDDNADTFSIDRPSGVGRNAARGNSFWQADLRMSRTFTIQRARIELLAEVFNVANHRNWIGHIGNRLSPQYRKPTAAAAAREIQLGVRVEY